MNDRINARGTRSPSSLNGERVGVRSESVEKASRGNPLGCLSPIPRPKQYEGVRRSCRFNLAFGLV